MTEAFRTLSPYELEEGPFRLIGKDWMLITAGTLEDYNTMTASWGGLGELWNRPVCFCFVRPQRHTYAFMERYETFTLSFFAEEHRNALNFCGSHSGRTVNKAQAAGLTPLLGGNGAVYFEQARLVFECRKRYVQDLDPDGFTGTKLRDEIYPQRDYHRLYIGEILQARLRG